MVHPAATLVVVAGLLSVASYPSLAHASAPSEEPRPVAPLAIASEQQWATFDVTGSNGSGNLQLGQPLELSITLGGIPHDSMPIVAICESAHFESQIVPLKPDPISSILNATASLAPVAHDRNSPGPQVSRLHVTFARSTETKFERLMTRIVYLTMGDPKPAVDGPGSRATTQNQPSPRDLAASQAEPLPGAIPLANDEVMEEDLLPSRSALPTPAYWGQVRDLLNRSWNRATLSMPPSSSAQTVRVQFRLYPGGHAQLMQIADGWGASEIDQVGIHTIVDAQPFPPFPLGVGNQPIEIHVQLQTGSSAGVREFRTGALRQLERTIGAPKN